MDDQGHSLIDEAYLNDPANAKFPCTQLFPIILLKELIIITQESKTLHRFPITNS